ncbi:MAG: protein kinase [Bacteroidetes bacterium]|nr:protein kinase [Bacteroidota bacterium]
MNVYNPNDVFANRYLLIEKIGIGGFSEVWKAKDQMAEDTVVAIKIYAPERGMDELGLKQFRREYAVVLNLNHRNLLTARHFDVFNDSPYLVMPFIDGGSVYTDMMGNGPWSEEKMAKLMLQMADALDFLHDHDVLHQDIKPDNILIDNRGDYLLTDFGISSRLRSSLRKSTTTGKAMTVAYAPPERFTGKQEAQPAGDIFSFGVLLYELSVGDVPWMGAGGVVVKGDSDPISLPDNYSNRFQKIVQACLRYLPEERPSAEDLRNWAQEFMREGAWPIIPEPKSGESVSKPLKRGRSTQRMDDTPFSELESAKNIKQSGKEAATMKQGSGASLPKEPKKKKTAMMAVVIIIVLIAAATAFILMQKEEPEVLAVTPVNSDSLRYDSLMHSADSLYALSDFPAAKSMYEAASSLIPGDSMANLGINNCIHELENIAFRDSAIQDSIHLASTQTPKTTPVTPPPTTKPKKQEEVRKPTEEELRRERLKGLEGKNDGRKNNLYDLTDMYSRGNRYDFKGDVSNGKPNGYGIAYFDDGERYEGNWVNGVRTGMGKYIFSDGTTYNGEWKNDQFNGKGKMVWTNGDEYEGSYLDGVRHGMGTYVTGGGDIRNCPDCKKYQGYWKNNDKDGFGKCFDKKGALLYAGDYSNGKPIGKYPNR